MDGAYKTFCMMVQPRVESHVLDHQITSNELMDQHLTKSSVAERLCFMLSKSKNDFDGMTEKLGCVGSIWGVVSRPYRCLVYHLDGKLQIQSELGAIRGHMNLMVHQQSKVSNIPQSLVIII